MSELRISEIHVQVVMLDEYDAILPGDPQPPFKNNANGTAVQHLIDWLQTVDERLLETSARLEAMKELESSSFGPFDGNNMGNGEMFNVDENEVTSLEEDLILPSRLGDDSDSSDD